MWSKTVYGGQCFKKHRMVMVVNLGEILQDQRGLSLIYSAYNDWTPHWLVQTTTTSSPWGCVVWSAICVKNKNKSAWQNRLENSWNDLIKTAVSANQSAKCESIRKLICQRSAFVQKEFHLQTACLTFEPNVMKNIWRVWWTHQYFKAFFGEKVLWMLK